MRRRGLAQSRDETSQASRPPRIPNHPGRGELIVPWESASGQFPEHVRRSISQDAGPFADTYGCSITLIEYNRFLSSFPTAIDPHRPAVYFAVHTDESRFFAAIGSCLEAATLISILALPMPEEDARTSIEPGLPVGRTMAMQVPWYVSCSGALKLDSSLGFAFPAAVSSPAMRWPPR